MRLERINRGGASVRAQTDQPYELVKGWLTKDICEIKFGIGDSKVLPLDMKIRLDVRLTDGKGRCFVNPQKIREVLANCRCGDTWAKMIDHGCKIFARINIPGAAIGKGFPVDFEITQTDRADPNRLVLGRSAFQTAIYAFHRRTTGNGCEDGHYFFRFEDYQM